MQDITHSRMHGANSSTSPLQSHTMRALPYARGELIYFRRGVKKLVELDEF